MLKKPAGVAVFLPVIMVIYGFTATATPSPYQKQAGILGGPGSVAEAGYHGDNQAILAGQPSLYQDAHTQKVEDAYANGIMESGLLVGSSEIASLGGPAGQASGGAFRARGGDLKNYFAMPTKGFNWKRLHPNNAVDIANACGTDIVAAAEGLVGETSMNSWNDGYGNYIMLSHPNDTKTRYAHLQKVLVSIGQYVKKGELIGKMGDTGNSTGCHVHFEVIGAENPFAK